MTVTVAARFPLGRYHATPWGRAANEAAVEWPPSPWRLLRALYAAWKWRVPEFSGEEVEAVLGVLSDAPWFHVPRYTEAHSRHYMPDTAAGRDKVLDGFAVVDPESEVFIHWPLSDMGVQHRTVLSSLCDAVSYLGRAESISTVRLVNDEHMIKGDEGWLRPGLPGDIGHAATRVLVPTAPLDLAALVVRTTEVRKSGRLTPPGARWVAYPQISPEPRPAPRAQPRLRQGGKPTGVLLRFDAPVLPSIRDAVTYGDRLRKAVMSKVRGDQALLALFSGKDAGSGESLHNGHRHPHFLAFDADDDRLIDSAVVWFEDGFDDACLGAILDVRKLVARMPKFRPVRVAAETYGPVEKLAPKLCTVSARWRSVTPCGPYRHRKKETLEDFLRAEIDRELKTRGLVVSVVDVRLVPGDWLSFSRRRPGKGAILPAWGIEIELSASIPGPLALGALSHFGLGLFEPVL